MTQYLGLHETLELHELLTFKNLSLTKAFTMSGLVQDPALKEILLADVEAGTKFVIQIKQLMTERSDNSHE